MEKDTTTEETLMPKMDEKGKVKNKYLMPNFLAIAMSKVSMRTQMESSLLSMSLLVIGMILMAVYMILYGNGTWAYRVLLIINLLCGMVFLSSYLITNFQQYTNYMDNMGYDAQKEKANVKAKGNLFKRIMLAFKESKKNKKAIKAVSNIEALLSKSGVENELYDKKDDALTEITNQSNELERREE